MLVLVLAPVGWPAFRNFSQVGVVGESCLCFSERYGTVRLEVVFTGVYSGIATPPPVIKVIPFSSSAPYRTLLYRALLLYIHTYIHTYIPHSYIQPPSQKR